MLFKGWLDDAITVTSSHVSMVELELTKPTNLALPLTIIKSMIVESDTFHKKFPNFLNQSKQV
jgi:hypothetical protein